MLDLNITLIDITEARNSFSKILKMVGAGKKIIIINKATNEQFELKKLDDDSKNFVELVLKHSKVK